jgi:hypothetical protein
VLLCAYLAVATTRYINKIQSAGLGYVYVHKLTHLPKWSAQEPSFLLTSGTHNKCSRLGKYAVQSYRSWQP